MKTMRVMCVVLVGVLAWCAIRGWADAPTTPSTAAARPAGPTLNVLLATAAKLVPLQQKMDKPKPGDWLATYPEAGQTFEAYRDSKPNRPTAEHTTLYIQPLGDFTKPQQRLIDDTADFLGRFYGVPVKQLDPVALDTIKGRRNNPHTGQLQLLSTYILDRVLLPRRPKDAVAVLGLTAVDLYPEASWNFVFGQASLVERVGVWSIYRYGDPVKEYPTVLRRTLKVSVHETGHMFGIQHCIAYKCGMNGSNSLEEADRQPMPFCAECDPKIWWACGLEPVKRYGSLAEFAEKHELKAEGEYWRKAEAAVKGK